MEQSDGSFNVYGQIVDQWNLGYISICPGSLRRPRTSPSPLPFFTWSNFNLRCSYCITVGKLWALQSYPQQSFTFTKKGPLFWFSLSLGWNGLGIKAVCYECESCVNPCLVIFIKHTVPYIRYPLILKKKWFHSLPCNGLQFLHLQYCNLATTCIL